MEQKIEKGREEEKREGRRWVMRRMKRGDNDRVQELKVIEVKLILAVRLIQNML